MLALEVQRLLDNSDRYTQYLKDSELFTPDEEAQRVREWLKKARELEEKLGFDKPKMAIDLTSIALFVLLQVALLLLNSVFLGVWSASFLSSQYCLLRACWAASVIGGGRQREA